MATKTAAAKKATVKKSVKKTAKKAPVKKVTKKAPVKKATTTKREKGGLRKPQIRVLGVLKDGKPKTRQQISEKGNVDLAMLTSYIGGHDEDRREKNDQKVCVSLLTLKYVTFAPLEEDNKTLYTITAAGKKAIAAA